MEVVGFGAVDAQTLVQGQTKLRKSIESRSSWSRSAADASIVAASVSRRNPLQRADDGLPELIVRHSFPGACSRIDGSQEQAAEMSVGRPVIAGQRCLSRGRASIFPEASHARSEIFPNPTSATCGG
jgi:hypothetical protein